MAVVADPPARPVLSRHLCVYLVLLASFVLYAPSLANDFTWDDRWAAMGDNGTVRNPLVAELQSPAAYFASHYWPAKTPVSHTYRPVTVMSFALRHAVAGDNPVVAHLLNVALHVLAVYLAFSMLARLGAAWPAACLGALVFGVHAVHSEAVANVVGRAEMLGFAFGAGGFVALDSGRRRRGLPRAWRVVAAAAAFYSAFHSKESALAWVAFAPLCLALSGSPDERSRWWRWLPVLLVPAAVYLVQRQLMLASLPGAVDPSIGYLENPLLDAPVATRILTGLLLWGQGLLVTLAPFDLAVDYGPATLPIVRGVAQPAFALSVITVFVLGGLLVFALHGWRRRPMLLAAVACFLGFSFVVTNIPLPVFMMFGERTYYTPSFGLAIAVAWAAGRVRGSSLAPLGLLALGAWAGVSSSVAWQRNAVWHDDATLIRREVVSNPRSVRMQLCAGDLRRGAGDLVAAAENFLAAARLDPAGPEAWTELASVWLEQGRLADAAEALRRAGNGRPRDRSALADRLAELGRRLRAARAPR